MLEQLIFKQMSVFQSFGDSYRALSSFKLIIWDPLKVKENEPTLPWNGQVFVDA